METSPWKIVLAIVTAIALLIGAMASQSIWEHVGAGEVLIVQSISGSLSVYTDPGLKWQGLGNVTHFRKSAQFSFRTEKGDDQSIKIRFNDGGHAQVSGSIRMDLPSSTKELLDLYSHYGTQEAIEHQLVRTVIEKSIYMTGPLMSSKESYAEKRNDLINLVEDQATLGVYQTTTRDVEITDPITGQKKTVTLVEPKKQGGLILRQEESPLTRFDIKLYNLSFNEIKYDATVEGQIAQQQSAVMQVQTAIANSRRAEQDALTTVKQGEASAAKAKWEQESINAKMVSEAEGRMKSAEFDKKAAEFTKQREILLGQGEAERKRLVMEADGALEKKLDAWTKVQGFYADALAKMQHPIVPTIMMNSDGKQSSGAFDLIEMLKARTASELAVDIQAKKPKGDK